jgi:hypothetical protein
MSPRTGVSTREASDPPDERLTSGTVDATRRTNARDRLPLWVQAVWKRARAENAQNCFLSFLLSTVTVRAVLLSLNAIETNFLRASSTSEFSHSLGQKQTSSSEFSTSAVPSTADTYQEDGNVSFVPLAEVIRSSSPRASI